MPSPPSAAVPVPGFLVFDTSYTLEMIRKRGIEDSVLCRDLDGFFERVWTVHPFATMLTSDDWTPRYGVARQHRMSARHIFIEGTVGRFRALARLFPINFVLAQLSLFFTLWSLIRREDIRLIRVGEPMYGGLFGWALSRLTGIPLVVRISGNYEELRAAHGPIFPALFRSVAVEQRIEHFVFQRADLVAAPNQDNADYAVRAGTPADRVTIFRYGNLIAREHLAAPEDRDRSTAVLDQLGLTQGKYLMCVGRLDPVKLPEDTVQVLGELAAHGHDVKLLLVGDGPMKEQLHRLATSLGVADRLVFAGNLNQTSLARLLPDAGVVLSPLTGRALTEAAFAAAPIVAYDADWQGELIETGKTGFLVPNRDWCAMADAAGRLLDDRAMATALGHAARARTFEILGPDKLNDHERAEYRKLLGCAQPA